MSATQRPSATPVMRDPGLQAERTALAWSRTGLAVLANGLLTLRAGWISEQPSIIALALALLIAAIATFAYGRWRGRGLLAGNRPVAPPARAIGAVAGVALAACVIGFVSLVLSSSHVG
jgi:uncharacterized membrane protein YidH (DUF202 family)